MSAVTSFVEIDGLKLHVRTYNKSEDAKAKVLIVHGYADRTTAYEDLSNKLAESGYEVVVFDQRGFGESATSKKDYGISNEYYVFNDLDKVIGQLTEGYNGKFYLLGHSMGGGIVLNYMVKGTHRERVDGYVVNGPLIEAHPDVAPSKIISTFLPLLAKFAPKMKRSMGIDRNILSHDEQKVKQCKEDPLRRDLGSVELINDMVSRGKRLTSSVFVGKFVDKPLLVCHGTEDKLCDINGSRKLQNLLKIKDKTMLEYEGAYHETHNEVEQYQSKFFADVLTWLNKHVSRETSSSAGEFAGTMKDDKPEVKEAVASSEEPAKKTEEEPVQETEEPVQKTLDPAAAQQTQEPAKETEEPISTDEAAKEVVDEQEQPKAEVPVAEEAPEPVVEPPKVQEPEQVKAAEPPKVEETEPPKVQEPEPVEQESQQQPAVAEELKADTPAPQEEQPKEALSEPKEETVAEQVVEEAKPETAPETAPEATEPVDKVEADGVEPATTDADAAAAEDEEESATAAEPSMATKQSTDSLNKNNNSNSAKKKKKNNKKKGGKKK